MADIIHFPDGNKRLLKSGNQNMSNQDFLAAKRDFKALYQLSPTFSYAKKLILAMQNLGDYSGALQLADDHFTAFMNDSEGFTIYFHLLLLDAQFLTAHKLLSYIKTAKKLGKLEEELQQVEKTHSLLSADLKTAKKRQLEELDKTKQPFNPRDWQSFIKDISLKDFIILCQEYLIHAKNPFIPPKLVEELVKDGAKETVNVHGKKVNLAGLPLPEDAEVLVKTITAIEEKTQDNPQLQVLILPEIRAHFALMYPFLPDASRAEDWAQSYLLEYRAMFGEDISVKQLDNYQQIQDKKRKIRQIYESLSKADRN